MTEEQTLIEIEAARQTSEIQRQAEEIATARVKEVQDNIARAVGAGSDNDKYDSMSDMRADINLRADTAGKKYKEEALSEIRAELEAKETKIKQAEEARIKQTSEEQQKEWNSMTAEWKEAVADGIAPPISDELNKKLEAGTKYSDLTEEERNDQGLVFYNRARQAHVDNKRTGKATSFYRTIAKFDQKPSSASAPIFGGSVAAPSSVDEFTDSDLNEATNRVMNMGLPTR